MVLVNLVVNRFLNSINLLFLCYDQRTFAPKLTRPYIIFFNFATYECVHHCLRIILSFYTSAQIQNFTWVRQDGKGWDGKKHGEGMRGKETWGKGWEGKKLWERDERRRNMGGGIREEETWVKGWEGKKYGGRDGRGRNMEGRDERGRNMGVGMRGEETWG